MEAKGTTPTWARPVRVVIKLEVDDFNDINVIDLLVITGFVQSRAEAKRMIQQKLVWLETDFPLGEETFIWDRINKLDLFEGKFLLVEPDTCICIGRILDEAICHRINFVF